MNKTLKNDLTRLGFEAGTFERRREPPSNGGDDEGRHQTVNWRRKVLEHVEDVRLHDPQRSSTFHRQVSFSATAELRALIQ